MWRASGGCDPLPRPCRPVITTLWPLALGWEGHPTFHPRSCKAPSPSSCSDHLSFGFSVFLWVRKLMSLSPGGGATGRWQWLQEMSWVRLASKRELAWATPGSCSSWSGMWLCAFSGLPAASTLGGLALWASCSHPWPSPSCPPGGFPHSWHLGPQWKQGFLGMEQAHGGGRAKAQGCGRLPGGEQRRV